MLCGFEEHNSCRIVLVVEPVRVEKAPTLRIVAQAWPKTGVVVGQEPLVLVSVICSALNLKAWNSALTHVMYALDFQLALNELGHAEPKKA